ncbi:MAG: N-acetylglucosamine-6-phosphate deacetylase [Ruminococcus sp.]|nr:N-acetylglucosamine-6-phosphate deacetylase [Ruminococcus sp.]
MGYYHNATVLKNGLVFSDGRFVETDTAFSEGRIVAVAESIDADETIDCSGLYVLPGLCDIHLHGCAGHDVCDGSAASIDAIAEYQYSRGVTCFCPTTMTLPTERLKEILRSISGYTSSCTRKGRAEVAGINLEGPFVSAKKCGAQKSEYIQSPSAEKLDELLSAANGLVKLVTIAPEVEGAIDCISACSDKVRFSLGHTDCGHDCARRAFMVGADHLTHLFNAMPPFHHRDTGPVGAAFDDGRCYVELICDGVHISPTAVRAAFRLFGDERIVLISDSMEAAGMPDGEYSLGGQRVIKKAARATLSDGTLAGSVSDLYDCLVTAVEMGIPLESAVRAATLNPCRSVGIDDRYGSIAVGNSAHFLLLDRKDLSIKMVI